MGKNEPKFIADIADAKKCKYFNVWCKDQDKMDCEKCAERIELQLKRDDKG
jgi:hypothetical protein